MNGFKLLVIFVKSSVLDVWLGSEYTTDHNVIRFVGNEYVMASLMYSGF